MSSSVFSRVISAIAISALLPLNTLPVLAQDTQSSISEAVDMPQGEGAPAEDQGSPEIEPETTTAEVPAEDGAAGTVDEEAQTGETAAAAESTVPPDVGIKATSEADLVGTGGEYVYTFPFDLPEYHNLVPDLRLRYNSSRLNRGGPDNTVALGWRLGGLSRIERVSIGGGLPTYDDGQDIYRLDGADLMACNDSAATNKWTRKYPLSFLTEQASASCSAGGNLSTRIESHAKIRFDRASNEIFVTRPNGVRYRYQSVGDLAGDTRGLMPESAESYAKAVWSSFGPPVFTGEKDVRPPEG